MRLTDISGHVAHFSTIALNLVQVQEAFRLKDRDFKQIVLNAVDYTFTNEETKAVLRERIQMKLQNIQ